MDVFPRPQWASQDLLHDKVVLGTFPAAGFPHPHIAVPDGAVPGPRRRLKEFFNVTVAM
jgi:hypothetical protein